MESQRNLKLFIILIISLSLTSLINSLSNPLFRLKTQLRLKSLFAKDTQPQQLNRPFLSVNQTADLLPTQMSPLPTSEPTTISQPTLNPTIPIISPTTMVNFVPSPTQTVKISDSPSPTPLIPSLTPETKTELVWRSIFKGVSAAENSQTGDLSIKIDSGTQYVKRTYTLTDGRQITVLVPLFKE